MMTQPMPTISIRAAPPPQRWWEQTSGMVEAPARLAESGDVADIPDAFWLPLPDRGAALPAGAAPSTPAPRGWEQPHFRAGASVLAAYAALGSSAAVALLLLVASLARTAS